jgi:fused signal recognition particle receptor
MLSQLFGKKKTADPSPTPVASASVVSPAAPESAPESGPTWRERLKAGLALTREKLNTDIRDLFSSGARLDAATYDQLETILISADVGVAATQALLDDVRRAAKEENIETVAGVRKVLRRGLLQLLSPLEQPLLTAANKPYVIMMVGVNGAGKTTSIGKLAHHFQRGGKRLLLAAGDTFRAAAREQLTTWGERNGVTVIGQDGGDSASVVYDAVQAGIARGIDIVLADTAGRLPTQLHLMEEIRKVKRVLGKAQIGAPHEVLLVIDANTGQNAVAQVKAFHAALGVTGLIVTKLDGTAKGGSLAAIAKECPIPIRFVGVGETLDDLKPFIAQEFVDALLEEEQPSVEAVV